MATTITRAASLLVLLLKATMFASGTSASTSSPTQNLKPCSICGEDLSVGSFDACRIGDYMAVGNLDGFYDCDEYASLECNNVYVDYPYDSCYACGKGRIVSRPADTISKLSDNPREQWQYFNRYSCQTLQDEWCFGDHRFESWMVMDYSPELIELFEENCGCEDRQVCALCPPGHRLQYPRHFIMNYILPDDDWSAPDISDLPPSQWDQLPCGVVELRGKNSLVPSELCHMYQSMVKNDHACGGCVPIAPKLSTPSTSSSTPSSSVAIGINNYDDDNTNTYHPPHNNTYHRVRFPASAWIMASLVAVLVVVVVSRKRNNGPKQLPPEFELIGLRCRG